MLIPSLYEMSLVSLRPVSAVCVLICSAAEHSCANLLSIEMM